MKQEVIRKFRNRQMNETAERVSNLKKARDSIPDVYEKNRVEIDAKLNRLLVRVCTETHTDIESFRSMVEALIEKLFYKRPGSTVIDFITMVGTFPPFVILEATTSFFVALIDNESKINKMRKQDAVRYFNGILRNKSTEFQIRSQSQSQTQSINSQMMKGMPDDI